MTDHELSLDGLQPNQTNLTDNSTLIPHASEHGTSAPSAILFIFMSCALGAFVRTVFKRAPVPYTVILLVFGMLLGLLAREVQEVEEYTQLARMDPHILMHAFLPVLIFESAFAMETHTFLKAILQIVLLAIPGLLLAAFLTALFAMTVFSYGWNWSEAMMFGSIISATDPVAVVALLKDVGASKQLGTLIEGESLLNDGAAIVLFEVCRRISLPGNYLGGLEIFLYFVRVALGGPVFGFVVAKFTILWLRNIFNDALAEITITLASTYVTFYVGEEFLEVSGVLAVVVLGLTLSTERTSISPEVEAFLHRFWEMLAYLANTLIFLLVGVIVTKEAMNETESNDWVLMVTLYCAINAIRALMIAFLCPLLKYTGYGLTWRNATVLMWSGLRGAVGLALALVVNQEEGFGSKLKVKVLLHCAGIVLLTLLINATTISKLLEILGMSDISVPKRLSMASAVRTLRTVINASLSLYRTDRFLADAEWDIVAHHVEIEDPYKTVEEEAELDHLTDLYPRTSECPNCMTLVPNQASQRELKEMKYEARMRLLKAEKTSYWRQFEHGMLSRDAIRKLNECVDSAADREDGFVELAEIQKTWKVKGLAPFLKKKLEQWRSQKGDTSTIPIPENKVLALMYKIGSSTFLEAMIYVTIFVNVIFVVMEMVIDSKYCGQELLKYKRIFDIFNYIFLSIYIIETLVKMTGFRKYYFYSRWNVFDFVIVLMSFVDLILDLTWLKDVGSDDCATLMFNPSILKIAKVIRMLRVLRSLRLVKGLIPPMIKALNARINVALRFGYDVGKGYIMAEEEVHSFIDLMVDHKEIADSLKDRVADGRVTIMRALGMLQKEHPGIAVSVKTQQAARRILNNIRDKILEFRGEGLLDENEAHKLELMVEFRMKRLLKMPASMPPPPPEKVIYNVSWVREDPLLVDYIKNNAQLVSMTEGEILFREGDPLTGIYVIVSGLLKVEGEIKDHTKHEEIVADFKSRHMIPPLTKTAPTKVHDYLTTGSVIGEIALLTQQTRNATVSCETSAQLYLIPYEAIQAALELFVDEPPLEQRLWRVCSLRLSIGILKRHIAYRDWTPDRLSIYLEKGVVDIVHYDMERERQFGCQVFEISTMTMSDVILIYGLAEALPTGQMFNGPCYIPNTLDGLILHTTKTDKHVILVIPRTTNVGLERSSVMSMRHRSLVDVSKNNSQVSSLCLKHAAETRRHLEANMSQACMPNEKHISFGSILNIKSSTKVDPKGESKELDV